MDPKRWAKVSEIFAAVYLDTPHAARETEIASHCAGDTELEAEVRQMIASAEVTGPLDEPLGVFPDSEPEETGLGSFVTGQLISGRFRLIRFLGQGGMGQVWEAFDEQLRVPRALKTIRPEVAGDPAMIERFKREVERAQSVTHPHVCRVYDLSYEREIPFLSMELLSGESLAERLRRGKPLARNEVAMILRQCASALDAAHRAGLVHRDFKPANVMLVPDGEPGVRAVVMDFGLALSVDAPFTELSTPGAGTPAYMAPEQAAGDEITPSADIYAFGIVACKIMSGKRPSEGGLELVPRRQRAAFLKCLDPDPIRRPNSCSRFLEELYNGFWSRRRLALAIATTGGLGLLHYATVGLAPAEASVAILPFEQTSEGEDVRVLAHSVVDGVLSRLAREKKLRVVPRASSAQYSAGKDRWEVFARKVGARFLLIGTVGTSRGRVYLSAQLVDPSASRTLWAQTFDRPEVELLEIERAVADAALAQMGFASPGPDLPAAKRTPEADRSYRLGRYHLSRRDSESLRKARQYFQAASQLEPEWAPPRVGLAQTLLTMAERQDESPRSVLPVVQAALDRALASDPQVAEAHATLGLFTSVHYHDFALAERSFQRAIDLEPNNATAHQWYSFTLAKERRFSEALRQSKFVLELDPLSVAAYQNHALILFCVRRYPELIAHVDRLTDLDPNNYWAPILRAYAHAASGRPAEALHELDISLRRKDPPSMVIRMAGEVHLLLGDRAKGLEFLERLERMKASGAPVPSAYIGFLHAAAGQKEEAFRWLEAAWTEGDTFLSLLFVYPACDPLRSDPRYQHLVARLGIRENMSSDSRPSP